MTREEINAELDVIMKMPYVSLEEGFRAAEEINKAVLARGGPIMTMDEINEEIAACRRERRERERREQEAVNERAYCL